MASGGGDLFEVLVVLVEFGRFFADSRFFLAEEDDLVDADIGDDLLDDPLDMDEALDAGDEAAADFLLPFIITASVVASLLALHPIFRCYAYSNESVSCNYSHSNPPPFPRAARGFTIIISLHDSIRTRLSLAGSQTEKPPTNDAIMNLLTTYLPMVEMADNHHVSNYKLPLYVISVSRCLQLRPALVSVVVFTFWLQRGTKAANARNLRICAKSLRDGSSLVIVEARAPTPMLWPKTLSQFAHIFKPIHASTGPLTGRLFKRCFAPSRDKIYPVRYQIQDGMPKLVEYFAIGAVLGREYPMEQK